jgi:hypothetical protein
LALDAVTLVKFDHLPYFLPSCVHLEQQSITRYSPVTTSSHDQIADVAPHKKQTAAVAQALCSMAARW